MKILAITHLSTLYGANRSLLNLIQGTKADVNWIVVCRGSSPEKPSLKSELNNLGIKCYNIPFRLEVHSKDAMLLKRKPFFIFEFIYNFVIAICLAIFSKFQNVSIIHSNSSSICLGAYVSYLTNKPHIWHFREFLDEDYRLKYNLGINFLKFWADKAALIIAISKTIQEKCVINRRISAPSVVLYNGVIPYSQMRMRKIRPNQQNFKLLILGVLDETKNQLDAIKATQLLLKEKIDVTLNIVGGKSGSYFQILEEYVKLNNLYSYIRFIDYVPSPQEVICDADTVLVCSKNEGMGRVTLESMAYGVPVVGYDGGGTSELIQNNFNGLLYLGGPRELADKISLLIKDELLYNTVLKNGLSSVSENYTIEVYSNRFLNLLKKLNV